MCNFGTTTFKKKIQELAAFKTFNYAATEGVFQKWKLVAATEEA